jgi:hypothetical protein
MFNDFFISPTTIQRALNIAPLQMADGSLVENPNFTAYKEQTQVQPLVAQQSVQTKSSKTILYVMIGAAVIMAGVLIFIILKRK